MLRSLLYCPSLFLLKPTQKHNLPFIASLSSPAQLPTKTHSLTRGKISDILQILGPIHLTFPIPEVRLYISLLKKCIRSSDSFKGSVVHARVLKSGFGHDLLVCNVLLDMYAKGGSFRWCCKLFDEMPERDIISWCTLISAGLNMNGYKEEAISLLTKLLSLNSDLKEGDFVTLVNACSLQKEGMQIHSVALKTAHFSYLSVGNALISMYVKFGEMEDAARTFEKVLTRDVVSWTALMTGYVRCFDFKMALEVFQNFRRTQVPLDKHCVSTALNACTGLKVLNKGRQLHSLVLKLGLLFSDFVISSFINMYAKCRQTEDFTRLYSQSELTRNLVLVNVVLSGFCLNCYPENALELFLKERQLGFVPDQFTYSTILSACRDMKAKDTGDQIHSIVLKSGFANSDIIVGNSLIDLYLKCECLSSACKSFYSMGKKNANSYAMLMLGHIKNGSRMEALKLFSEMQESRLHASPFTFTRILRGCADMSAVDLGKQVHASIIKIGLVSDVYIEKALVGLYAKSNLMQMEECKRDFGLIGVFTLEEEEEDGCENYENALEFDQNFLMVDFSNCVDNEENILKFTISDQIFLVANLRVPGRVNNVSLGLHAT